MAAQHHGYALYALLLGALLSACAVPTPVSAPIRPGTAQAPALASLAGTAWVAFAIDRVPEVLNPKPKLRWTGPDRVAGTGGCNGFNGRAAGGLGSLRIGPLDSTGRACLSMPGSQEDLFFRAMELTRKARMDRDQLVLLDESGKEVARFLKTD